MKFELGFLGAGNMAEAIVRAAIGRDVVPAAQIVSADPIAARRESFEALGVTTVHDNATVVAQSRHILLAIKPQTLPQVAAQLQAIETDKQIVLSIMAGVSTDKIEQAIGRPTRVVRIMPNTPLLAKCGMASIAVGRHARDGDDELAIKLFGAAGEAIRVGENLMDAITAVSGSGPAYVFYLAEAMEQAARDLGLGNNAPLLVRQTILGAARLMCQSQEPPERLRTKVTSPGGTTEAAIRHMDANATTQVIINAIKAAEQRSRELGV